jgi:EAL domain-containing protein (putative c-di-GMP-specific phosphodiesterase class I)
VIRKACVQMREIDAWSPVPLHLSVNLSRAQLADEHVVDVVAGALAASGLDPRRLTLEVTESVLMRDMSTAVVVLERLREIGVKIAIDDFGTGYSSLSVLKDLPVDTLKIDRAFVTGLAQDKESVTMAERILELASDFSLHTVAEGVEEPEQLEVLRTLGCDSVQGWIFYRALPADELSAMLRQVGSAVPAP